MTAPPDHDELLLRDHLRARIDGAPAASRPRDWLDDYLDATAPPPAPPARPPATAPDADEPRWDWRRLLHWPYARLTCGAGAALLPLFGGSSAATGWGSVLSDARTQAGVSPAWIMAATGLCVGAVIVHKRRTAYAWALLTCAFIGTVAMASPFDIVTFVTGVTR